MPPDPTTSLFNIPSLPEVNWALPALMTDPDGEPPPWFGWAGDFTMWSVLYELLPILRSLDLAGYQTTAVEFGLRGAGEQGADGWIRAYLDPMLVSPVATGIEEQETARPFDWGDDYQTAFVLRVTARYSVAMRSLAIPGEVGLLPLPDPWTEDSHYLTFRSATAVTAHEALARAIDNSNLALFGEGMITGLAQRWKRSGDGDLGPLNPYDFSTAPGLLWLFDPTFWETDPPSWAGDASVFCRDVVAMLKQVADGDPESFLRTQIENHASTIAELLKASDNISQFRSREFFRLLQERNEELGNPIQKDVFDNLAGPGLFGFRSYLPYLEVLMHIASARLFPFPALPDPRVPSPYDWEGEPFEVTLVIDHPSGQPGGVDIRIFDCAPVTVYRALDLGYPYDRCFTWEYKGPDKTGTARLVVVAAPGVAILGRENLPRSCSLTIYRVQDHELVPAWGERIPEQLFTAPYDREAYYSRDIPLFADEPPTEDGEPMGFSAEPQAAFRIQSLPAGCRICYPALASAEDADFLVDIRVTETSPYERFTFEIEMAEGRAGELQRYALNVLATPGVEIGIRQSAGIETRVSNFFWRTRESNPALVPPPGEPLDFRYLETVAVNLDNGDPQFSRLCWHGYLAAIGAVKFLGQMGVDIGIGMIPIVGDAVDIAEFAASFGTGTDKWGQPVTNFDRMMMAGGILLPFVSSGVLRGLARAAP